MRSKGFELLSCICEYQTWLKRGLVPPAAVSPPAEPQRQSETARDTRDAHATEDIKGSAGGLRLSDQHFGHAMISIRHAMECTAAKRRSRVWKTMETGVKNSRVVRFGNNGNDGRVQFC